MPRPDEVIARVSALVVRFKPGVAIAAVTPEQELVGELGYDSVRLVELLLACGESFGVELPLERILERGRLTPRVIATHVAAALETHD